MQLSETGAEIKGKPKKSVSVVGNESKEVKAY